MLNLTWTALAPELEGFDSEDFELWFQVYLIPLIPSFQTESLLLIPGNISCASYTAM